MLLTVLRPFLPFPFPSIPSSRSPPFLGRLPLVRFLAGDTVCIVLFSVAPLRFFLQRCLSILIALEHASSVLDFRYDLMVYDEPV